ncbi:MAG TPA: vWA domain-containing protein [Chroococcales cyanobacterium]
MKKLRIRFVHWLLAGLCLSLVWACNSDSMPSVNSFEDAQKVLQAKVLPKIQVEKQIVPDQVAARYAVDKISEPLPPLEDYSLYGAQPSNDPNTVYIEIFSSTEKGNAKKQDERWLVDVAEAFNSKKVTASSGQVIQVGIRNIPSGVATRLLAAKAVKPTGFTPSNELWLAMLKSEGVPQMMVNPTLVPNYPGFLVQSKDYQALASRGTVTFETLLNAILAGKLTIGYPNPYASSSALNLLYTVFWRGAGHHQDKKPLTVADLQSPQVNSVFDTFQKQVLVTTLTTLDLKDIFIRDQQKLQAFPLEYQSYATLKRLPGFEQTVFIPFGVPHNSPLVGFEWNTPTQQDALKKFAEFATSAPMQQLAKTQGFEATDYLKSSDLPPVPSGEVLKAAQTYWKQRKDGGRTVYMTIVIDTSGSMEGDRLKSVKQGLQIASNAINSGNQVGLITFSDRPKYLVPLAPFDTLQHQRLLAAIDRLEADGSTAMYDGTMVGLADLMERKKTDPNGRFYLLLLSDGEANAGFNFEQVKDIVKYSEVRVYPIAYGEVNQQELQSLSSLRESTVQAGNPQNVQRLLKELFQTNL